MKSNLTVTSLGDNSDVTWCVYGQINIKHLREKIQFPCFQFRKVV